MTTHGANMRRPPLERLPASDQRIPELGARNGPLPLSRANSILMVKRNFELKAVHAINRDASQFIRRRIFRRLNVESVYDTLSG